MKAAAFDYTRASSVEQAIDLLREHAPSAQILAGGQSLMAMMKMDKLFKVVDSQADLAKILGK